MELNKNILIYILVCVFFFSCEKKNTSIIEEAPDGYPVITDHPKSAVYLESDVIESLTVNAVVSEGYNLSYQWYYLNNLINDEEARLPSERQISNEFNKLKNLEGSLFEALDGMTEQSFDPSSRPVGKAYLCIVTSASQDGSKTFKAVSNPAVVKINYHPLRDWYLTDRSLFSTSEVSSGFIDLEDIAYGNGYFVAIGNPRDNIYGREIPYAIIAYSDDGISWDLAEDLAFDVYANRINAIAYGNDRFVAVGAKGKIVYSTDAKTWIPVKNNISDDFRDIVYGNDIFIANFRSGLAYSGDGETWFVIKDFDTSASRISCIAYCNGRFFTGSQDGKISFSDDGKTWTTLKDNTFDSLSIITISYGNGCYLAFARIFNTLDPDDYKMGYSLDGETWAVSNPSEYFREWYWIEKIVYNEGYFIAAGSDKIAFSKDGRNWNNLGVSYGADFLKSYKIHLGRRYNAIAYGGGYFVVVSDNGIIVNCQWPMVQ
jgi:predicted GH43/DUF377 family glycosyl hydrolase